MPNHPKPKAAIIGAGFSGLSSAWHLLNSFNVILFHDENETSKIAAGLFHKYVGLRANLNPLACEAEKKSLELFEVAKLALNEPIILSQGILRIALGEQQKKDFYKCSSQNDDVEWLSSGQCQALDPYLPDAPGIFIHSGMTIDTVNYLKGLQLACEQKGLIVEKKHISDLKELQGFDVIVLATGAYSFDLHGLKLHALKGQLLELEWPHRYPPLPFAISSQVYLTMTNDKRRCIAGATYEHHFTSDRPDEKAIEELFPKAIELYPPLKEAKILTVKAALRCTAPSRLPCVQHIRDNVYAIVGMGSRGLLYHAYFAEKLAKILISFA